MDTGRNSVKSSVHVAFYFLRHKTGRVMVSLWENDEIAAKLFVRCGRLNVV